MQCHSFERFLQVTLNKDSKFSVSFKINFEEAVHTTKKVINKIKKENLPLGVTFFH